MDIDIDFKTTFDPLTVFNTAVNASMVKDGKISRHPAGIYFQNMAKDPITGLSAIPYKEAEQLGFTKIDFLHLSILDNFENKDQIRKLIKTEPDWDLLLDYDTVQKLFQVSRHYSTLSKIRPKTVQELADCIALIRPQKKVLIDQYIKNKEKVRTELYKMPLPPGCFKRGHAVSYSLTIVLQLHLIKAGIC